MEVQKSTSHFPSPLCESKQATCTHTLLVTTLVISIIMALAGVLAFLAANGSIPGGAHTVGILANVGKVNSYLFLGGGSTLCSFSLLGWWRHTKTHLSSKG
ncbi:MAG: hypothetical protein K940chlam9_00492 [Chlamydiae bacterium]|nr:hypothetical protein [Chlamydiota bacterium]